MFLMPFSVFYNCFAENARKVLQEKQWTYGQDNARRAHNTRELGVRFVGYHCMLGCALVGLRTGVHKRDLPGDAPYYDGSGPVFIPAPPDGHSKAVL